MQILRCATGVVVSAATGLCPSPSPTCDCGTMPDSHVRPLPVLPPRHRSRSAPSPFRTSVRLLLFVAAVSSAHAQSPTRPALPRDSVRPRAVDTVKVVGRIDNLLGIATSASEGRVGAVDLRQRPITREGELLETVPGLIVTQHSGDGKANQYFVRGFNLDHGTDFQTKLDGMPLNMPTHGHGQGYTDLNFLIPELVDYLDYKLGVSHAELGNFGSAGGAEFHLMRTLDRPFLAISGGANGFARLAGGASRRVGAGTLLVGGEAKHYDGPWLLPEDIRKVSGVARYSVAHGSSDWSVMGMAYRNRWNASDQIPSRAVTGGLISRFGQIDSTNGGNTRRYSLSGSYRHVGRRGVQQVQAFGIYSDLRLFSNFGYFLDDASGGDQFAQHDRRTIVGANAKHTQQLVALGTDHAITLGVQARADIIADVGLFSTVARSTVGTVRRDRVRETGTGAFAELESRWQPWFRSVLGVREDVQTFHVTSDIAANSGERAAAITSPKVSFIFSPGHGAEVYVSGGSGFHSNDARGTTITVDPSSGAPVSAVNPLVRSRGAEVGLRASPVAGLRSTLSVWALNLDSELLFIGDAGNTEAASASRRHGITVSNFYRPLPQLALDADVSFATARFHGVESGQAFVPGALENVLAAGATWTPVRRGVFAAVRVRHFGAYPLIEDNSVRAHASGLVNADVGYALRGGSRIQASLLNVLNASVDDIQYYYTSRLRGEPSDGVSDVHFHPAEPRQVRVSLEWKF